MIKFLLHFIIDKSYLITKLFILFLKVRIYKNINKLESNHIYSVINNESEKKWRFTQSFKFLLYT